MLRTSSRARSTSSGHSAAPTRAGFSLGELLVVITIMGLLSAFTAKGVKAFSQQQQGERTTKAILWEVSVARSYALRSGGTMSLVADETNKILTVRDEDGKVWHTTRFGAGEELRANAIDVNTPGDSLAFSPRGICLNCNGGGATTVTVVAGNRRGIVSTSILGRTELVSLLPYSGN
jgi:prepilin-type N-terminal cleavage/methylation domain-containing protein